VRRGKGEKCSRGGGLEGAATGKFPGSARLGLMAVGPWWAGFRLGFSFFVFSFLKNFEMKF
jgi:hypothetical protein